MAALGWYWVGQVLILAEALVFGAPLLALILGQLLMIAWLLLFGASHNAARREAAGKHPDA